jgi:hypothetical protein
MIHLFSLSLILSVFKIIIKYVGSKDNPWAYRSKSINAFVGDLNTTNSEQ